MDALELWRDRRIKAVVVAVVVAFFCYVTYYNWSSKVHRLETNISQFWDLLTRVCDERLALLPAFGNAIVATDPNLQPLANELLGVYKKSKSVTFDIKALNDPALMQNFVDQQQSIVTALRKIQLKLPPQIEQNEKYQLLAEALEAHDRQIQYAAHAIEKQINDYNELIDRFPERIVNKITRFPPKYYPEIPTLES